MVDDWQITTLGSVMPFQYGKGLPERNRVAGGVYRVVSSAGFSGKHSTAITSGPSIVIGRKGSIGTVHYCPDPVFPIDTTFYIEANEAFDIRFAYYLLLTLPFSEMNNDSAVPGLNRSQAEALEVAIPPLFEQRSIAATLGSLDDKIESNRRLQIIAEEWVRAHVERTLEEARAAGAEMTRLDEYCSLVRDGVAVGQLSDDLTYIGLEHMPRGSIVLDSWSQAAGLGSNKSRFVKGDILFGKLRPYFHKVGIAPLDGVCSTDILVIRPASSKFRSIVSIVASSDSLIDSLSASSTGTRMPRASWQDLSLWPVPKLSANQISMLANLVDPVIDRMLQSVTESRRLSELRDTLLPELLSGCIRVPETQAAVEVAI